MRKNDAKTLKSDTIRIEMSARKHKTLDAKVHSDYHTISQVILRQIGFARTKDTCVFS